MKKVLLTGISGYIGQHCALELLKQGYAVRGSLRNLSKKDSIVSGLSKEFDTKGNLEFCQLDLLKDDGWDDAMLGCDYVLHVASPNIETMEEVRTILLIPAFFAAFNARCVPSTAGLI